MSAKYVNILKVAGSSALVIGAVMIMLPDLVRLLSSLGRLALLIVVIAVTALFIVQIGNYLKRSRKSTQKQERPESEENAFE